MFSVKRAFSKTFICSLLGLVAILTGAGTVVAANTGVAPVLVPYTITAIAGNTQSSVPGFGGDGVLALNATLNGPATLAVDSVGNVYIADTSNALIREVNAQTGIISTIAGVAPTKCTGTTCTTTSPGCADGVPALGSQVGSRIDGMVVDTFGNLYFSDYNYQGVWVIYHGGAQVANFISLVDNATAPTASAVKPGYVYHIAGLAVPKAGGGCSGTTGTIDKVLATSASFHDPLQMGIDAAGNLYVQDFANNVVRVINTQATAQTFFGITVQPGYVTAVVGCNATLTSTCPSSSQFGIPAPQALFTTLAGMTTDQYGNVYQLNTKGATNIYGGVAYAGGAPLAHLINTESGLTATTNDWYQVINSITSTNAPATAVQAVPANGSNDIVLRPSSIAVDPLGNLYMLDYHWISVYRVDVNSGMATRINGLSGAGVTAGTTAAPVACAGTTTTTQFSVDAYGDGCPIQNAKFNSGGTGYVTFDGVGNLYIADLGNNIVRKVSVGTQFPSTASGANLSQTIQVHFDAGNLPSTTAANSGFKVTAGSNEFSIASTSCSNYTLGLDGSLECYVKVTFAPTASGARKGTLQATTANGSTYNFALSGFGSGAQLAVDGGAATTLPVTGLGTGVAAVATDASGNVYIADPANNRVVMSPAGGGAQTTVGTGLKAPNGVAVDPAGDVFISDSGNNRILEVAAVTGTQTVLTTNVLQPQGIALDNLNNLYVADTGNSRIVEIAAFGEFPAAPLLAYTNSLAMKTPVAVAVDKNNNVFVADSSNPLGLIEILAGGGDFQPVPGGSTLSAPATVVSFGIAAVQKPNGVAIDGAGDIYVSDAQAKTVQMIPSAAGPGSEPVTLNFPGLTSPAGLALDTAGNVYVADSAVSGSSRVLLDSRSNVNLNFGAQPQYQTAATLGLTVTNIGGSALVPASPFAQLSGATADFSESDTCAASNFPTGFLISGLHCSATISFQPVVSGPITATGNLQNGMVQLNITGTGQTQQAPLSMALTSPAGGPTAGATGVVTLTASQAHGAGAPTGTVTFNYTVNGVAQAPVTQTLVAGGTGTSTATLSLPNLLLGRSYVINAVYSGDTNYSLTNATPFTVTVPGRPLTVVANSVSFVYGSPVPTITGTVTGILPADQASITVSFTSGASATTPVGTYPIKAVLSGGNYQDYTIPTSLTPTGTPAVVTETQAPLTVTIANFNTTYGAPDLKYTVGDTVTGLVNGDVLTFDPFTNPHSQVLPVGTYTVTPTLSSLTNGAGTYDKIKNYKVTLNSGTVTVAKGVSGLVITQAATAVLPTGLSSGAISIVAGPPGAPSFIGTPTGTVTLQDTFTPLSATGAGTPVVEAPVTLTLAGGKASYTPADPTIGTHSYVFTYAGDANFLGTDTSATPSSLIVDNADFTVVSTSSPIQVAPGIIPGGVATVAGEQAATPEIATVYITPILGSTQVVNLTCAVPNSYITCTLTPSSVTLTGKTVLTSVVSVSTPATLPVNYTGQLQQTGKGIVYAFLPLTMLTLLPFCTGGRRIRASRLLVLLISVAVVIGATGCGGNLVKFFTPVPAGPSQVVITGTSGSVSRSFTVPLNIQ